MLSTNVTDISISSAGGTSATYTITTDGEYSISKPDADDWYTLQCDLSSKTFCITVEKNETDEKRSSRLTVSLEGLPGGETKQVFVNITQSKATQVDVEIDGWEDDEDWDEAL